MNNEELFNCVAIITTVSFFSLIAEMGKRSVQSSLSLSDSYEPAVKSEYKSPFYKLWQYVTKNKPSPHNDRTVYSCNEKYSHKQQLFSSYQYSLEKNKKSENYIKQSISIVLQKWLSLKSNLSCKHNSHHIDWMLMCVRNIFNGTQIYVRTGYLKLKDLALNIYQNTVRRQSEKTHKLNVYINRFFSSLGVFLMTIPSFIMVAAAYASTLHAAVPSTIVMQESWNNVYAINMIDELSHYPSAPKKTTVTIKQCEYNFDINSRQMSVENQKWSQPSLFEVFNNCKNPNVVGAALKHCCEQAMWQYNAERDVLSLSDVKNFEDSLASLRRQKNASYVEVQISTLVGKKSQEAMQFHTEKAEQTIKMESLPTSLENDVFAHKESSVHDAFAEEASVLERQQE